MYNKHMLRLNKHFLLLFFHAEFIFLVGEVRLKIWRGMNQKRKDTQPRIIEQKNRNKKVFFNVNVNTRKEGFGLKIFRRRMS
jgi:hypothetical protein